MKSGSVRAAMLVLVLLAACGEEDKTPPSADPSMDRVRREMKEALDATLDMLKAKRQELEQKIAPELEKYDARLEELRREAAGASAEGRVELEKLIKEVEERRQIATRKLEDAKSTTSEAWDEFSKDVGVAMEELNAAYERAKARIR